jgi:hypothetical protein
VNSIDFTLEAFDHHHEFHELNLVLAKKLLHLSCVFLNIRKHGFSIVFRNVFGIIPEGGIMGNEVFRFADSPSSPESYHPDLFLCLLRLFATRVLF